jgi:hypothetical protein
MQWKMDSRIAVWKNRAFLSSILEYNYVVWDNIIEATINISIVLCHTQFNSSSYNMVKPTTIN